MYEPSKVLTVAKRGDVSDTFVLAYLSKVVEHQSTHPGNYTRVTDLSVFVDEDMARVLGVGGEFSSEGLKKHLSERIAYLEKVSKGLKTLEEKIK